MTDLRKAAEMALEAMESIHRTGDTQAFDMFAAPVVIPALRQALEQPEQSEVTVLPDGSAFGVMSYPLPKTHWIFAEREYADGQHEPIELGNPILTHELGDSVVSAVRYAIRGATNCGKEMDFDPDALVQNAVYALCGPYRKSPSQTDDAAWAKPLKEPMPEKRVHETDTNTPWDTTDMAHRAGGLSMEQEPVAWRLSNGIIEPVYGVTIPIGTPLYATPPKREWVELTFEEADRLASKYSSGFRSDHNDALHLVGEVEALLKEKNT